MDQNVITLSFEEQSKAYQALSELKQANIETRLELVNAAVVERAADGRFALKDGYADGSSGSPLLTGTLIGSLVGVLAGPLGILLGGFTGAAFGSVAAIDKSNENYSLIEQMMHTMPPGATAVVATINEYTPEAVDTLAASLGGIVLRRPVAAIEQELAAQEAAQEAASAQARKVLREKQLDEWREKFDNWRDELGEKADALRDKLKSKIDASRH